MGHSEGASAIMCMLNDDPDIHSRIKGCIIIERAPISYRELSQDIEKFLMIDELRKIKLVNT
jgi:hypothetical protein